MPHQAGVHRMQNQAAVRVVGVQMLGSFCDSDGCPSLFVRRADLRVHLTERRSVSVKQILGGLAESAQFPCDGYPCHELFRVDRFVCNAATSGKETIRKFWHHIEDIMRIMSNNPPIRCECMGRVSPSFTDLSKYDAKNRAILPGTSTGIFSY